MLNAMVDVQSKNGSKQLYYFGRQPIILQKGTITVRQQGYGTMPHYYNELDNKSEPLFQLQKFS